MSQPPGILHVDLDAFYASVEQLADPTLRGRPVVVGGLGSRGVVAAASYEARRFGIHSAMPMARARRACPDAAFISPRFDEYAKASRSIMAILRAVTPLVEPISLDEAFLDVRGARRLLGDGPTIARDLRVRIKDETGLVASVGVATTKMLAKIASDLAKPDGLLVVEPGTELEVLHPLPVGRLWGVGPATRKRLDRYGVTTIGDLAALSEETLVSTLGRAHGEHLHALAWNVDDRPVEPERVAKSIGHEETFPQDVRHRATLEHEIVRLSDRVASRLRAAQRVARTVQLKLRYHDFRTITRRRRSPSPPISPPTSHGWPRRCCRPSSWGRGSGSSVCPRSSSSLRPPSRPHSHSTPTRTSTSTARPASSAAVWSAPSTPSATATATTRSCRRASPPPARTRATSSGRSRPR